METPATENRREKWSVQPPLAAPDNTPMGTPTTVARMIETSTSSSVAGRNVLSSVAIGWWDLIEVPRSPVSAEVMNRAYWTYSGLSRPSLRVALAICSWVGRGPTQEAAGSEGSTRAMKKVITETPNSTSSACRMRLRIYVQRDISPPRERRASYLMDGSEFDGL